MNDILTNAAGVFNAAAYYFKSAVALLVSNPYFLGFSVVLLLTAGKSLKLGRIVSAKG
ncbi:hypothetical protein [Sinanaerobacter chloroacetimidivorans]|uniref:Uncharacterized protein n=1 Tax=Sinanaerobacter chloroacetimidivorans TaxID=2818044 RepID=A0A8J8B0G3_9FIRM|nr:hypothetical protein [Sinanaerobacter chloroacetimidivorans]MBR0596591.1 hypothetical protein [Sinanaerobacter chloroacetimidivorans]